MTAQDLAAAKARVQQREQELADAQRSLAVAEHGEYRSALALIANAVQEAPSEPAGATLTAADQRRLLDVVAAVKTVVNGLGFRA